MDGTALIDEPEVPTVVRQTSAPKKNALWLWLGLAGLLIFIVGALVAGLLIYNFAGRNENTQAKSNVNAGRSPARTKSPTPKAATTPEAASPSSTTDSSPET